MKAAETQLLYCKDIMGHLYGHFYAMKDKTMDNCRLENRTQLANDARYLRRELMNLIRILEVS